MAALPALFRRRLAASTRLDSGFPCPLIDCERFCKVVARVEADRFDGLTKLRVRHRRPICGAQ